MSDEAIFKAIYSAGKDFDLYNEKATKEVLSLLNQSRKDIIDILANTQSDYTRYVNQNLKVEIDRAIGKLSENLKRRQAGFLDTSWELGIEQVDTPFRVLGVAGSFDSFKLDETFLLKLKDFSATLITNLSAETLPKIDTAIKVGLLKGDTFINVARQIGTNLKDPSIFKSVSERAIVIAQTEMNRVYNTATNDRYKMVEQYAPGLQKMWSNAGDSHVRPSHQRLNGQVVDVGKKFFDALTGVSIDRPGDPEAPAKYTVRCRCRSIPFKENWDIDWEKHGYKPYTQDKGKPKRYIFGEPSKKGLIPKAPSIPGRGHLKSTERVDKEWQKQLIEDANNKGIKLSAAEAKNIKENGIDQYCWNVKCTDIREFQQLEKDLGRELNVEEWAKLTGRKLDAQAKIDFNIFRSGDDLVEKFIKISPDYENKSELFRALGHDLPSDAKKALNSIETGDIIDLKGTSSFTSSLAHSDMFLSQENKNSYMYVLKGPATNSSSVSYLSKSNEFEVLFSKDSKFKVTEVVKNIKVSEMPEYINRYKNIADYPDDVLRVLSSTPGSEIDNNMEKVAQEIFNDTEGLPKRKVTVMYLEIVE